MEDLAKQAIYKKYHWIDKEYLDSFKSMYLVGWLAEYKEGNNDQT